MSSVVWLSIGGSLTWGNTSFDYGDFQVRPGRRKVVRAREARASRTDDDDVGDSALVHLGEVPVTMDKLNAARHQYRTYRLIMARETCASSIGAKR